MQRARPKAHAPVTSTTDSKHSKKAPIGGGGVGQAVPHKSADLQVTKYMMNCVVFGVSN